MRSISAFLELLKMAGHSFVRNHVPKLSASLAYFTIFSVGPMMLVIIFMANLFFEQQAVQGAIYTQVQELVGQNAAMQIQALI